MKMDRKALLAVLGAGLVAQGASAQLAQLGSDAFALKYEMDVDPSDVSQIDLDSNGQFDWFNAVAGGFVIPSVSGGIATSDTSNGEMLFRTDFTDSIQRTSVLDDYTIEVSVWINHDAAGNDEASIGYFGLALDHVNDTDSLRVNIDADNVNFNFDGVDPIATADNTDGFHTFRIAYDHTEVGGDGDPSNDINEYFIWRDDVLLNPDENTPFTPGNGSFNASGAFFIGNFSGSLSGEWQLDYIRIDNTGAYAPVSAAIPGDTDGDGDIDDSDLGTAFSNYTGPLAPGTGGKTAADGDTDGDGDVDDSDLGTAFSGYTGPLGPAAVPEPTSLALIGLGGLAMVRRRRA
ncbi:MAG: PEP-CTERM sorting domain-containing protein [Phycisphaeraceae bacterium]